MTVLNVIHCPIPCCFRKQMKGFIVLRFPSILEYTPPSWEELGQLTSETPTIEDHHINDPNSPIDNRTAIRIFLHQQGVSGILFDRLVEPYDLGFYKKCDGKSSPVYKLSQTQRKFGFKRDIVAVRHDLDYYRGLPSRRIADYFYLISQQAVGEPVSMSYIEWAALKLFGQKAWDAHREKRTANPDYGRDDFISFLPDQIIHEVVDWVEAA